MGMTRRRLARITARALAALAAGPSLLARAAAPASATRHAVPILYAGIGEPAPLTPEGVDRVIGAAAAAAPGGRRVWFVLILSNRPARGDGSGGSDETLDARAYYVPDASTPRLRKGVWVGLRLPPARNVRPEVQPVPYLQVSRVGAPFAPGRASVPAPPASADLPFEAVERRAGALPDEGDIVRAVDAARRAMADDAERAERQARGRGPQARAETAHLRDEPIHRVEMDGLTARVLTGWQVGPRFGSGRFVDLRRDGGEYRPAVKDVIEPGADGGVVGRWVS